MISTLFKKFKTGHLNRIIKCASAISERAFSVKNFVSLRFNPMGCVNCEVENRNDCTS